MSPYNCNKLYCKNACFLLGEKIKAIKQTKKSLSLTVDFSFEEFEIFRFLWEISYKDNISLHHL